MLVTMLLVPLNTPVHVNMLPVCLNMCANMPSVSVNTLVNTHPVPENMPPVCVNMPVSMSPFPVNMPVNSPPVHMTIHPMSVNKPAHTVYTQEQQSSDLREVAQELQ